MVARRSLGRRFGWLWAAYAVSAYGSGFTLGAFPLVAVLVLHSGPAEVSALSAAGRAVGAVVAGLLGPWVEWHRKRPVLMATDLIRFAALITVPVAYLFGWLTFAQLLVVSVVVAAARIAFNAAGGAYLKALVPAEDLIIANGRFESTTWTSTVLGPPLGGAAIGVFGPLATVAADAVSYLLSAIGIRAIGGGEPRPRRDPGRRMRAGDLIEGWRHILTHAALRPLFCNILSINALIMAGEPLLAVLLLGQLGFAPWQYGLAFAVPCVGGLIGSRLARRLAARFGQRRVLLVAGTVRACWPVGLAFVQPGVAGIVLVIAVQFGLATSIGVFNPLMATYRLDHTPPELVARTLSSWSVSTSAAIALVTMLWGALATVTGPRIAIAAAGVLMLATPLLLLPRRDRTRPAESDRARSAQPG